MPVSPRLRETACIIRTIEEATTDRLWACFCSRARTYINRGSYNTKRWLRGGQVRQCVGNK